MIIGSRRLLRPVVAVPIAVSVITDPLITEVSAVGVMINNSMINDVLIDVMIKALIKVLIEAVLMLGRLRPRSN
jgi:hypothetical protein